MSLDRTTAILNTIKQQEPTGVIQGALDNFLAQHLAVVLCSEIEEKIAEIIRTQLSVFTNISIANFLHTNMEGIIKRAPKSDIVKFIAYFGDTFKDQFNTALSDQTVSQYSNVIQARHLVTHGRGSLITLSEIQEGLGAAELIIGALENCFRT